MARHYRTGHELRARLEGQGLAPLGDDLRFLLCCLERIPVESHDKALERYVEAWQTGMERASASAVQNTGRRTANTFVRRALERRRIAVPDTDDMRQVRL